MKILLLMMTTLMLTPAFADDEDDSNKDSRRSGGNSYSRCDEEIKTFAEQLQNSETQGDSKNAAKKPLNICQKLYIATVVQKQAMIAAKDNHRSTDGKIACLRKTGIYLRL